MVTIRKAEKKDCEEIVEELWKNLMDLHFSLDKRFEPKEEGPEIFLSYSKECVEDEDSLLLVAEEEELIGYLLAKIKERPPVFKRVEVGAIDDIYVKEDHRGEGIGKKLVERAWKWFRKKDIKYSRIRVSPKNELGKRFWESLGYKDYLVIKSKKL